MDNSNQFQPTQDPGQPTTRSASTSPVPTNQVVDSNPPSGFYGQSDQVNQPAPTQSPNQPPNPSQVDFQQPPRHDLANRPPDHVKPYPPLQPHPSIQPQTPNQDPRPTPDNINQVQETVAPIPRPLPEHHLPNQPQLDRQLPVEPSPPVNRPPSQNLPEAPVMAPPTESLDLGLKQKSPNLEHSQTADEVPTQTNQVNNIANQDPSNFNQVISSGTALNPNLVKLVAQQHRLKNSRLPDNKLVVATIFSVIGALLIAGVVVFTIF